MSVVSVVCCQSSLRRADLSSREVLTGVVCISECNRETSAMRRP